MSVSVNLHNHNHMRTLQQLLQHMCALPDVRALTANVIYQPYRKLLEGFIQTSLIAAFEHWFNALSYRFLGESPSNGWPGDRGSFQLALKAGFFKIRYAFQKDKLNAALDAIHAALPEDVLLLEGVPTEMMRLQSRAAQVVAAAAANPQAIIDEQPDFAAPPMPPQHQPVPTSEMLHKVKALFVNAAEADAKASTRLIAEPYDNPRHNDAIIQSGEIMPLNPSITPDDAHNFLRKVLEEALVVAGDMMLEEMELGGSATLRGFVQKAPSRGHLLATIQWFRDNNRARIARALEQQAELCLPGWDPDPANYMGQNQTDYRTGCRLMNLRPVERKGQTLDLHPVEKE